MDDIYPNYDADWSGGLMGEHLIGENQIPGDWNENGVLGEDIFDEEEFE